MKKIIAIASIMMMSFGSVFVITGCEPGHKTTSPDNMNDSLQNNNNNNTMNADTIKMGDSSHNGSRR